MHARHLPIAEPCHADWNAMNPEGARRFCGSCQKHVHDLSSMTEAEATTALASGRSNPKGMCVRYRVGPDGNLRFRSPSVPAPLRLGFAAQVAAATLLVGCTSSLEPSSVDGDGCTYDRGAFSFTLARGEGNCPEAQMVEFVDDGPDVLGRIPIVTPDADPEPIPPMGQIAADPPPDTVIKGELPPVEIAKPEIMGKIAAVPDPEPVRELMGDIAPPGDEPCDPPALGEVLELPI
jgi:hypothetical protein